MKAEWKIRSYTSEEIARITGGLLVPGTAGSRPVSTPAQNTAAAAMPARAPAQSSAGTNVFFMANLRKKGHSGPGFIKIRAEGPGCCKKMIGGERKVGGGGE